MSKWHPQSVPEWVKIKKYNLKYLLKNIILALGIAKD